jgi:phage baseplate assembly protein W
MADLALQYGGDLTVGPTGDLALADGALLTQQRVLRRLLTNAGDYIWQLSYGAGLGQFVGQPNAPAAIKGVTLAQMKLEAGVAASPAPTVSTEAGSDGTVTLSLVYADATTGQTSSLSFSV